MDELNLPIIKGEDISKKKVLSMDDYLKFVEFNLKHTVNIEAARKEKKALAVNVPFVLR